jgi:hypothetical protein
MLLQERWMRKGASCDCVLRQLVTHIRRAKTVPNADKFGVAFCIALLNSIDPFRYCFVSECYVFAFPCFVVEVGIRMIIPVLPVFPDRVLGYLSYVQGSCRMLKDRALRRGSSPAQAPCIRRLQMHP